MATRLEDVKDVTDMLNFTIDQVQNDDEYIDSVLEDLMVESKSNILKNTSASQSDAEKALANMNYTLYKAMVEFLSQQAEKELTDIKNVRNAGQENKVMNLRPKMMLLQDLRSKIKKLQRLQSGVPGTGTQKLCYLNSLLNFEEFLMKDMSPQLESLVEMKKLRSTIPGLEDVQSLDILTSENATAMYNMGRNQELMKDLGLVGGKSHRKKKVKRSRRKSKSKSKSKSRKSKRSKSGSKSKSRKSNKSIPKVITF